MILYLLRHFILYTKLTEVSSISGINYAVGQRRATGRPSLASMSLSGPRSQALDDAVNKVGIHVFVLVASSIPSDNTGTQASSLGLLVVVSRLFLDGILFLLSVPIALTPGRSWQQRCQRQRL